MSKKKKKQKLSKLQKQVLKRVYIAPLSVRVKAPCRSGRAFGEIIFERHTKQGGDSKFGVAEILRELASTIGSMEHAPEVTGGVVYVLLRTARS